MNIENYRRVMSMPLRNVYTDNGGARVERGWMTAVEVAPYHPAPCTGLMGLLCTCGQYH